MTNVPRSIRDALAPEVDAHAGSFLGRRWGGMPGPVWSLAIWFAAMSVLILLGLVTLWNEGLPVGLRLGAVAWWAFWACALVLLRDRTPGWLLHLLLDAALCVICLISLTAATDVRAVSMLIFAVIPAVYAATWFARQQMAAHLLLLVLLTGATVIARGQPDAGRVWIVLIGVSISLAYFVNALVSHLNQRATIDTVTGLLNRVGLAMMALSYVGRAPTGLNRMVVVLDLDGFKAINDRDGHAAGDDILRQVGAVMRDGLRPGDAVARMGGDEFAILLMRTDLEQAEQIVDRLVGALPVPCSYGITGWPVGEAFELSLVRADADMYDHKRAKQAKQAEAECIEAS